MKSVNGMLKYCQLDEWWLAEFSPSERSYIETVFKPLGSSGNYLTDGNVVSTNETPIRLLQHLAGWFAKPSDRHLAYRMLTKAESLASATTDVLDLHFLFSQKISIYYKDRTKPTMLDRAIEGCYQQIRLGEQAAVAFREEYSGAPLPHHRGYEQLAVIREKEKAFGEALEICAQAAEQGWAGDWGKRIQRCRRKASKG